MRFLFFFLFSINAFSQGDTAIHDLSEVTVTANIIRTEIKNVSRNISVIDKKTIEASPVKTLDGVLQYALNVDVRSRSAFGVQADISIRGGHYDQTLILVDGVKVNDPQTGHHALNIPVPFSMIEKIEVLQGGASRVFGPSAFSGVINIITKKEGRSGLELQVSGGEYGTYNVGASGTLLKGKNSLTASLERAQSDGFFPSTFYKKNVGSVRYERDYRKGSFNLGYGYMNNDFGASNFYHPKFVNQYEEVSAQLFSSAWKHRFSPKLTGTLLANYRIHTDMFDFDNYRTTNRAGFINFHKTGVWDLEWKFVYDNVFGKSAFGVEYRNEKVVSNRLGELLSEKEEIKGWSESFYTHGKSRENVSFFLEHNKTWNKFNVSLGALLNHNSQFGRSLYPGLDLGYALSSSSRLYYSINRSLRYPTFTELYLNNNTVVGDPNLLPEKALTNELGFKVQKRKYAASYSVFYTRTKDAIDKIKRPDGPIPAMENIDDVNLYGIEVSQNLQFDANPVRLKQISFNLAAIWANRKEEGFQSFYTLNYLKQKVSVGAFFEPIKNLTASVWYTYKHRAGQYSWDHDTPPVNYDAFSLVDVRLAYVWKQFTFTVDANNLLNEKYFEFGFVPQPPRWISGGVRFKL